MEKIVAFHELNYKEKVTVMAEVPGVVTVMGAFSDFCDGYCLAGTGALGLRVALSPRDDMVVRVYDATRGDKKRFNLTVLKHRKEEVAAQAANILAAWLRTAFGERVLGPDKPPVGRVQLLFIKKIVIKLDLGMSGSKVRDYLLTAQQRREELSQARCE